ncbi:outer membrane beta-barrel protein [Xanthomonas prunicola]|uniref:OmpW/AlkL family protein n=1 Tax=Xanthomonas prunicola TaxID=2053930 RepID=UPI0021B24E38|nr:OmpW family outer membrane protein [Xanthomonas prunicola]UXA54311.1 outer membrane beta-barrel protein [Xanthomonas prunicola]UXA68060.1 outer membrane beta-barrel protein [Xanthomonas prunicola]
MRLRAPLLLAGLAAAFVSLPALAQSKGDWTVAVGAHQVAPKSDNGRLAGGRLKAEVGKDIKPTFTTEYFITDDLGVEVLAALPFEHDIAIRGLGRVGSTKQLPPVISLQYHFNGQGKLSPFVGVGINHTRFFSTDTRHALAGNDLELGDSWGVALHAGMDYTLGERGALRVNLRWIDIESEARLDGNRIGTVNIDPLVYGVAYVHRF